MEENIADVIENHTFSLLHYELCKEVLSYETNIIDKENLEYADLTPVPLQDMRHECAEVLNTEKCPTSTIIIENLQADENGRQTFKRTSSERDLNEPPAKKRTRIYNAPPKLTRKKSVNPIQWLRNVKKHAVNSGMSYLNEGGKNVPCKKVQPSCDESCRFKCVDRIADENRNEIHKNFWKIANYDLQMNYLASCMRVKIKRNDISDSNSRTNDIDDDTSKEDSKVDVEKSKDNSNEEMSSRGNRRIHDNETYQRKPRQYSFRINERKVSVCKKMFLSTLDISDKRLQTLVKKQIENENIITADGRGKHKNRVNRISENTKQSVVDHINSIPRVEGHYTRADSKREVFEENLTTTALHRLYMENLGESQHDFKPANLRQYNDIMATNFNIVFHKPKKDQCDQCCAYQQSDLKGRTQLQEAYDIHFNNKERARELKNLDKKYVSDKSNINNTVVAAFDYQKVLLVPKSEVSCLYYKRKLSLYNFTIADEVHSQDICYCYDESIGNKGSNEVASFVYDFIQIKFNEGYKNFRFHSDNCSGQNRNRFVFAMYLFVANELKVNIIHRFLEKGHTQNDCDLTHSIIERRSKRKKLFTPSEWYSLIEQAKDAKNSKFVVKEVQREIIFNWKNLVENQHWNKNDNNMQVPWSKIREVCVDGNSPGLLKYKTEYNSDYSSINIVQNGSSRILNRQELTMCYSSNLKINSDKIKDLMSMCQSNVIPHRYHNFYEELQKKNNEATLDKREHLVTAREIQSESIPKAGIKKTSKKKISEKSAGNIVKMDAKSNGRKKTPTKVNKKTTTVNPIENKKTPNKTEKKSKKTQPKKLPLQDGTNTLIKQNNRR